MGPKSNASIRLDEEFKLAIEIATGREKSCPPDVETRGGLWIFTQEEKAQFDALESLMLQYIEEPRPKRPLCIAVFGAPGSGKTFAVEQIANRLRLRLKKSLLQKAVKLNLTQIGSTKALAAELRQCFREPQGSASESSIPLVFFDEFDTHRDGAPWGWLSWFLAPMQDGTFQYRREPVTANRAIYCFAGGTASSFADFGRGDPERFRHAKGPDFVSRLHAFLDIRGPNDDERRFLRRAVQLNRLLGADAGKTEEALLGELLSAGRFVHGVRSMEAVIGQMRSGTTLVRPVQSHLLRMHADRGPLDPEVIGGEIGMSAGGDDETVIEAWRHVAKLLLLDGATLNYGGKWQAGKDLAVDLTEVLEEVGIGMPGRLGERAADPAPRIVVCPPSAADGAPAEATWAGPGQRVQILPPPSDQPWTPTNSELSDQRLVGTVRRALELFRMRYATCVRSAARFVIGGKIFGSSGRFPGVAEEVMLALAAGQPVYVAGGFGGAAEWVGRLLGLDATWTGRRPLERDFLDTQKQRIDTAHLFRPSPWTDLPIDGDQLSLFLAQHALRGSRWIDNGLDERENTRLFRSRDPREIAELVRQGLRRRFES